MRLYATTTSERASKGQGGEWIDIEIKNHLKEIVAEIKIREIEGAKCYDTRRTIEIWHNGLTDVLSYKDNDMTTSEKITKGEKQKGEQKCKICGQGSQKEPESDDCIF